jgi:hypothetical protein
MAVIRLPETVMGPELSVKRLAEGDEQVYCLIPDWFLSAKERRVPDIYIRRAAARRGIKVHVRWAWCREDIHGEAETVFLLTRWG